MDLICVRKSGAFRNGYPPVNNYKQQQVVAG